MPDKPNTAEPKKPRRRWFQFRLRTLLLAIFVLVCGMRWLAAKIHAAWAQRNAVESIIESGGEVEYDYEVDENGHGIATAMPPGPDWLRQIAGRDFFANVVWVSIRQRSAMRHLASIPSLRGVAIRDPATTDMDLSYLGRPSKLRVLFIIDTRISDAGLRCLGPMPELTHLCLAENLRITDAGLNGLRHSARLDDLDLNGTKITDAGLEHLKELVRLTRLDLGGTRVTDVGLAHLSRLTQLRSLNIAGTSITDAGLVQLARLPELEELYLNHTRIGDAGIGQLSCLAHLKILTLADTNVTDVGLRLLEQLNQLEELGVGDASGEATERLQRSLPFCRLQY